VFYVTAQLPHGGSRMERAQGGILVVPREIAGGRRGPALFEVAGCLAFAVGARVRTAAPAAGAIS
jgi:hypothetical protein